MYTVIICPLIWTHKYLYRYHICPLIWMHKYLYRYHILYSTSPHHPPPLSLQKKRTALFTCFNSILKILYFTPIAKEVLAKTVNFYGPKFHPLDTFFFFSLARCNYSFTNPVLACEYFKLHSSIGNLIAPFLK